MQETEKQYHIQCLDGDAGITAMKKSIAADLVACGKA